MTEREEEKIAQQNYELGKLVQQEDIAKDLRSRAGLLYQVNRDVEAKFLRDLANELDEAVVQMRQKYEVKYHKSEAKE